MKLQQIMIENGFQLFIIYPKIIMLEFKLIIKKYYVFEEIKVNHQPEEKRKKY